MKLIIWLFALLCNGCMAADIVKAKHLDYWLEFAELEIAIDKSKVKALKQHYISQTTMTLVIKTNEYDKKELGFSRLDPKQMTGGLHSHLNLDDKEFFARLVKSHYSKDKIKVINQVFDLKADSSITEFNGNNFKAYFINRDHDIDDSLFLISDSRNGGILISGEFSNEEAEMFLSSMRWP